MCREIDCGKDNGRFFPEQYFTHKWLLENLKKEYYEYILNLPLVFRLKLNSKYSIVAFHAAHDDIESWTCGADRTTAVLEETYAGLEENIVIYGHYHEHHVIPMGGKLLINCAAVGMRKENALSNYTVIEYDDEKIVVIQKQVPYDKNEEDELVIQRGMVRRP